MLIRPAGGLVEFRRSFSFILPVLSSAFYMEVVLLCFGKNYLEKIFVK